jgi:murein DD-endopeptidase MepM/ murein hydrolase activator NlpD
MRDKLALIIALAGFAVVTALGVGVAGAGPEGGQIGGNLAATPGLDTSVPVEPADACANELDDDGDGLADAEDPDCAPPEEEQLPTEPSPAPEPTPAPEPAPAEETETDTAPAGVKSGSSLDAGDAGPAVVRNRDLGGSGATGPTGAVTAPPATGGVQPPADGPDGGSAAFDEGGSPTAANPSTTFAPFGPAPIGVPNFVIDSFEIPPFLLPIFQACGTQYGIPWEILASINKIETAFGTNLNVSSAGAMGWMQFIPSSWEAYGTDSNGDGRRDPYNPVDAICAAARYLKAAGGTENLYDAIFAYNHADWYVDEVLLYARAYGKLPADLVGSLTGLTEGAHFPVAADARYADDISTREALRDATPKEREGYGNAAAVISSSPTRRGINIFASEGSPVVAVNDGVVVKLGSSDGLGRYVVLRDAYGNRFTYAELGSIARKDRSVVLPTGEEKRVPVDSQNIRPRLFALPGRAPDEGQEQAYERVDAAGAAGADGKLRVGSRVIAGTVLARIGAAADGIDPHINFSIRPAGRGAPRIDPKPILDGWKLLEATAIYRAKGKNPFAERLGSAGVLLLSKNALERRVLADRQIELPDCDRLEVRAGQIDRRLLATLAYLAEQGYRLTITSLLCGRHGSITTSGNVSNHSFGSAVDIAMVNGIPILGNQGPGSITNSVLKDVLRLQGTLVPEELISLEELGGPSFAMGDHADHIHIGWQPAFRGGPEGRFIQLLRPDQWMRLTDRLEEIQNPEVPTSPSPFAVRSGGKKGEDGDDGAGSGGAVSGSGGTSSGD